MPWKPADAKDHMKGLTPKQMRQWANIANSARQRCIDNGGKPDVCDVSAIKQANGVMAKQMGESASPVLEAAVTKTDDGNEYTASDYVYVPDAQSPDTWKLRVSEYVNGKKQTTAAQIGRALAALSSGGFRGKKVQIPSKDLPAVKAKLRALWKKANPDKQPDQMPAQIKEGNYDMHITSEDLALDEKGRTLNANNETLLRQAAALLVKVIKSIKGDAPADDAGDTTEGDTKEAGTFNQTDTFALLQAALAATNGGNGYDTYIADVYEDQGYFIYRKGYSGGYFRCDFDISTNGAVTLGNPETVVRKVTYITPTAPATESGRPTTAAFTPSLDLIETELDELVPVQLVEKAVANDGTVMLKLIAPGKGSSGYYTADVLKRDGPRVFTRGMHNFIDHPTPQEESERPEGSITRLGSTLVEDARWLDTYRDATGNDAGPGLYARAKVQPRFAESLDAIAENIGTSIRAMGKSRMGTIGDYKGPIIEAITSAKSVDYVTMPGAGGKVLSLVESARKAHSNTQGVNPMNEEELNALRESINTLTAGLTQMRETQARAGAVTIVESALAQYNNLPAPIRAKLVATLPAQAPLTEDRSAVNVVDFGKLIETTVKAELEYVQSIGASMGLGQITGFASADALTENDPTKLLEAYDKELEDLFTSSAFGLSEKEAKAAIAGRD